MGTGLLSPVHIMVLGLVVLLLFGAKRLPEIGRGLGTGMREFKTSVSGEPTPEQLASVHPLNDSEPQAIIVDGEDPHTVTKRPADVSADAR